jgi:hypothetical protein
VLDTRVKHDPVYSFDRITGRVLRGASVETTAIHCGVEIRTTFVVGDAP